MDCWRGLGVYPASHSGGSWELEYQDFIRDILNGLNIGELQDALNALPANEDRVWIGAYRYYEYPGFREEERVAKVFSEESLARVARRVLPLTEDFESGSIIDTLAKRSGSATNHLLLEIADLGSLDMPRTHSDGSLISHLRLPNAASALLALAKNQVAGCRPILIRRMDCAGV